MGLSTNGQSCVPPGFRFHPTEEELVSYYLRKKASYETIDLDVIRDVDLNKLEPWDLHERCKIGSAPQNEWYFFSHKDKKYPTGTRTNRATTAGFWKATGRDKAIYMNFKRIGMRKTLVFYTGRAPHGQKTEWIMHEYRLEDNENPNPTVNEDAGWVVCRVFKKRIHHKDMVGSQFPTTNDEKEQSVDLRLPRLDFPCEDHSRQLDLMSKQCKPKYGFPRDNVFIQMPQLQSPEGSGSGSGSSSAYNPSTRHFIPERLLDNSSSTVHEFHMRELMQAETDVNGFREDWTVLNSLVNQQAEEGKHQVKIYNGVLQTLNGYSSHTSAADNDYAGTEIDYWNYVR